MVSGEPLNASTRSPSEMVGYRALLSVSVSGGYGEEPLTGAPAIYEDRNNAGWSTTVEKK